MSSPTRNFQEIIAGFIGLTYEEKTAWLELLPLLANDQIQSVQALQEKQTKELNELQQKFAEQKSEMYAQAIKQLDSDTKTGDQYLKKIFEKRQNDNDEQEAAQTLADLS